jgi:hypothetical protein
MTGGGQLMHCLYNFVKLSYNAINSGKPISLHWYTATLCDDTS